MTLGEMRLLATLCAISFSGIMTSVAPTFSRISLCSSLGALTMIVLTFICRRWRVISVAAARSSPKETITTSSSWMPISSMISLFVPSARIALVEWSLTR
jgi:hypothetical protein